MIRPAGPADAEAIAATEAASLADAWSVESVRGEIAASSRLVIVDDAGRGHAIVMVAPPTADLLRIAVRPEHRGAGLATRLLAAAREQAAARGAEAMLLEVADDNAAARALYARDGFGEVGRRKGYYAGGVDALVLRRELR